MAPISIFHSCIVFFTTLASIPISSSSFESHNIPDFSPEISIIGDAQIVAGESAIKLKHPSGSGSGLLLHPHPFKFLQPNDGKPAASFSTEFFSITPGDGDGTALLFVPKGSASRFSSGQYEISRENKFVGVDNVSSLDLVPRSGEKLKSWVDYDGRLKRLEIRISKMGEMRPDTPVVTHHIDLQRNEDVLVGLRSSKSKSKSKSNGVYSWELRLREEGPQPHRRTFCPLAGMIFGTACGALFAFVALSLWAILGNKYDVEHQFLPMNFRYEKIDIVVQHGDEDTKF